MRTIKFRGVAHGKFIYGNLVMAHTIGVERKNNYTKEWYNVEIRVDHNTVGQYTGLKDKNDVDIYEGDLVELCNNNKGSFEVAFINQYEGGWNLKYEDETLSLGARKQADIEVVGNIHEELR